MINGDRSGPSAGISLFLGASHQKLKITEKELHNFLRKYFFQFHISSFYRREN